MAYGVLSERQAEGVVMALLRTGSRTKDQIERVLEWASEAVVNMAALDMAVRGEIALDMGPDQEIILAIPQQIREANRRLQAESGGV